MSKRGGTGAHTEPREPRIRKRAPRYRRGESVVEQNRLKRSLSDWRISLRIARRSVRRTLGTSAVVVTMVALPVAGFSAAALVGESAVPTASERITAELGQNEARLYADNPPSPTLVQKPFEPRWVEYETDPDTGAPVGEDPDAEPVDPRTVFPAGTEFIELRDLAVTMETAGGKGQLAAIVGPIWGDEFAGRTTLTDGRAPSTSTEVLASPAALERLGTSVGSTVEVLEPGRMSVAISGILTDGMYTADFEALYFPESAWSDLESLGAAVSWYLPDTEVSSEDLGRINPQGVTALSRSVLEDASVIDLNATDSFWLRYGILLFLAAAFAVFEIILLAGAAFAVGARKQQRSLATVASVGGSRRILYRIVTAQGLVLGLVGGLIGVVIGIPAGAAFMELTRDGSATQYWGFHLNPVAMSLIVVLAAIVGLLSAVAPARAATTFDVLSALRGSRKPPAPNRKAPTIGLVLMLAGVALTLVGALILRVITTRVVWNPDVTFWLGLVALVVGPILAQIGIIACGALVLRTIARLLPRRAGLGARLATRDSAAHPSRAVPAFAAIMVTAFIGVIAINVASSSQRSNDINYAHQIAPGQVQVWIPQDEKGEATAEPRDLIGALSSTVDVDQTAVISSGRSVWGPDGEVTAESTPWPTIPAENVCPSNPESADYSAATFDPESPGYGAAVQQLASDWRCAPDNYFLFGLGNSPITVVSGADELELLLGKKPSPEAVDMLASGGAVAFWPDYIANDELTISWWSEDSVTQNAIAIESSDALSSVSVPAIAEDPVVRLPIGVVVSPETAKTLGIETTQSFVLASLVEPATQQQLDAATEALEPWLASPYFEAGASDDSMVWILGALGLCGILFLGASTVAIGLARADGRQDDATLTAVGATRLLRRNFAFWQAVVIVGIGAATGTLAGLLTTYAISLMDTRGSLTFDPPWPALGLLVLGLPLVIAAGSWLVASRPTTLAHRMSVG